MRDYIYNIIKEFYVLAINDVLIGYHFAKFNDPDILEKHLIRLTSFWEMQLTGTSSVPIDEGFRLLYTHFQLNLKKGELGRWIKLFHQVLDSNEKKIDHPNIKKFNEIFKERIALFEQKFLHAPTMFK